MQIDITSRTWSPLSDQAFPTNITHGDCLVLQVTHISDSSMPTWSTRFCCARRPKSSSNDRTRVSFRRFACFQFSLTTPPTSADGGVPHLQMGGVGQNHHKKSSTFLGMENGFFSSCHARMYSPVCVFSVFTCHPPYICRRGGPPSADGGGGVKTITKNPRHS